MRGDGGVSYTDPRLIGGLARASAPPLDEAGIETTSEPESLRARAVRVLWHVAVIAELVALRAYVSTETSRRLIDTLLVGVVIAAARGVLSGLPWLRWLEDPRPRPSRERSIRLGILFVWIQVFVVSSLIMGKTPDPLWIYGGLLGLILTLALLPPWIADRWPPAIRAGNGRTT
jgi:hypothetical protein